MSATDKMVCLLAQVLPKEKIYPEAVPATVQVPFIHYSESARPAPTYDGNGGDTMTVIVTVCATTKSEAAALADRIVSQLDGQEYDGSVFYFQGPREYTFYYQERISGYDLTFTIL